eukprot:1954570-Rhodomonas_salina.2
MLVPLSPTRLGHRDTGTWNPTGSPQRDPVLATAGRLPGTGVEHSEGVSVTVARPQAPASGQPMVLGAAGRVGGGQDQAPDSEVVMV